MPLDCGNYCFDGVLCEVLLLGCDPVLWTDDQHPTSSELWIDPCGWDLDFVWVPGWAWIQYWAVAGPML